MQDCLTQPKISLPPLNSLQVTGRVATHVRDVADPPCVLHPRAAEALRSMREEARSAGIDLYVVSAFRDFNRQLAIWSAKFNGQRPLLDPGGAQIVQGPDSTGVLGVTPVGVEGKSTPKQLRALAARLRTDPRVLWIQPLADEGTPAEHRAPDALEH